MRNHFRATGDMVYMDVMDAIETRLDIKEFSAEAVAGEDKRTILEAGRLASSGMNVQHWRFILIDDVGDLERLGELSPTGGWVAGADFAIVIVTDPEYEFHEIDAGRALTHMQLAAWERDIGSRIYTVDAAEVAEFLEVPEELTISAVVGFGIPAEEIQGLKDRKPLDVIAFQDRFGQRLDW